MAPPKQPAGPRPKRGYVHAVPCPWCDQPNDLTEEVDQGWGGNKVKLDVLQKGNRYECDHCKRIFQVQEIQDQPVLIVVPVQGRMR